MENNGEQFYRMMMEIKKAMEILENVCEKLTAEYFNAKPAKIHTVSPEALDVFDSKRENNIFDANCHVWYNIYENGTVFIKEICNIK